MIIERSFWQDLIENSWQERNIVWLMGVRRVGKTSLCQSLEDSIYFDCELPRVRQLLSDPEEFLASQKGKRIILDEIHRLDNPSEILKIAADHYPTVKIIATGSSTLGASAKFRDTLTGRKREIWLTPLLLFEMALFGNRDIRHRFLFGGFPDFFMRDELPEKEFQEWIDAYWAKDIQELFRVGKRYSFQKFVELLLAFSGGQFEASKFSVACEVSRQTIANYLAILEETFVVSIVRPYSTYKPNEIVMAPKVYGLDTGFVCFAKGWREIRQEDLGLFWEHCILNELQGQLQVRTMNYWRDKQGHEIDFIYKNKSDNSVIAIECKFNCSRNNIDSIITTVGKNLEAFRKHYPNGKNYVVASNIDVPFNRQYNQVTISFVGPNDLINSI